MSFQLIVHYSLFILRTYSYGDSAGFSPDFPFNPGYEHREPLQEQM